MAEGTPEDGVKASINIELRKHYQRQVDAYRPDLQDDTPPREPLFHPLHPCHLNEQREKDKTEISVANLLDIQLQDKNDTQLQGKEPRELPRRLLLLGRPESGKTALYALILHYWLHGKDRMKQLKDFDFLLAVQCLGLKNLSSDTKTAVNLEEHILDHLPESIQKHGKEVVKQTMSKAKVLILIDSFDCLAGKLFLDEATSLAPWVNSRAILFCRYKVIKDKPDLFNTNQSKDNLVLKLWGGMSVNILDFSADNHEQNHDLGGVFSEELLKDYGFRLCECKKMNFEKFWDMYTEMLKYLSLDMRKPFNIYMAMEAFCGHIDFDAKTPSELYSEWLVNWTKMFKNTFKKSDSDLTDIIGKGNSLLNRLAYQAFTSDKVFLSHEDSHENAELELFLAHFLMPHYDPQGNTARFTFRTASHKWFLAARQTVAEIDLGMENVKNILLEENFKKIEPLLPMVLGVARRSNNFEKIQKQAIKIVRHNLKDHVTKQFRDPIINYAVSVLSETNILSKKDNDFCPFVKDLVNNMETRNWSIVDGNMHPEALTALCQCAHEINEGKPDKLNIILSGSPTDMPGLCGILRAVKEFDVRINLNSLYSFLNEEGKFPLDNVVSALQVEGKASLASFSGSLSNIKQLDTHPATRRIYKINLRICSQSMYENLRELCKVSHKLSQVTLRISYEVDMNVKKLKELPSNVSKLTVFLEGFTDENKAISIWSSIQGSAPRSVRHLCFWVLNDEKMTPTGVMKVIRADLSGTKIEVSLRQPISDLDKDHLQEELNKLKEDKYVIRLLGSHEYKRLDMRKEPAQ